MHDAVAYGPGAVENAAAIAPTAGYAVAAVDRECLSRWVDRPGQDTAAPAPDLAGDIGPKVAGEAAVAAGDACAPRRRAVGAGELLDHTNIVDEIELRPAERFWKPERK